MLQHAAGSKFTICLWEEENGACPTLEYLTALEYGGKREREDWARLEFLIKKFSDHGAPTKKESGHSLGDGIYELKAPNGGRIAWFYLPGQIVLCTHGFHKPAGSYRAQIDHAKKVREQARAQTSDSPAAPAPRQRK